MFQLRQKNGRKSRVTEACDKSLVCAREADKAPQLGETDGGAAKVKDRNSNSK